MTADRFGETHAYIGNNRGFNMYDGSGNTFYLVPAPEGGDQPQDVDDSADKNTTVDPWETFDDLFPRMLVNYEDWPFEPNPNFWPIDQIPRLNP